MGGVYAAGAYLVLNAHDHNQQCFAPQDPSGKADAKRGIREFVVAISGNTHYTIGLLSPTPSPTTTMLRGVEAPPPPGGLRVADRARSR